MFGKSFEMKVGTRRDYTRGHTLIAGWEDATGILLLFSTLLWRIKQEYWVWAREGGGGEGRK